MDPVEFNREAWDRIGNAGNRWFVGATPEEIAAARAGDWSIKVTPVKAVPRDWLHPLKGRPVLLLGGGGGRQGPLLAAAGAAVTVVDISSAQLARDRQIGEREGLTINTVQADMQDLAPLAANMFDIVINPTSVCYCPELQPVWSEAFRVLRKGGKLVSGMINPVDYLFDPFCRDRGQLRVRREIRAGRPYRDQDLPAHERERLITPERPLEYGHSLTDLIGGPLAAGFQLTGFFTDRWGGQDKLSDFIDVFLATCLRKPL